MAREREVVVGRVGRVLRTQGGSGGETLNPACLHEGSGGPGAYSASAARPGEGVGSGSSWPPGLLGDLVASFSAERMSTYVAAAAGDRERAVALYAWNTVVSGAFYEPLQGVVALVKSSESDLGSTTRCCGLRWHRQTTSVRVCSPSSRRLATLGPRFAGLTALTTAPRTLVRTGSCLSMPNPRPQDVAVDDLFRFSSVSDDR